MIAPGLVKSCQAYSPASRFSPRRFGANVLERPRGEATIVSVDSRAFAKEPIRVWPGTIDGVVNSQFDLASAVEVLEYFDLRVAAARVLNLTPAALNASFHAQQYRL